ncbi:MAG: RNA polymerase sigma factor [Caldilineales bacterium]|nr:RNA polymerase sigma factor [Caldilineales bacterium]
MNEPNLAQRARLGDVAAWEALVREHQTAVFRMAYLLLNDADDAEDVAQETFLRAFRYLDRFDADRPLRPWLVSISANLARNRRRSIGRYFAAVQRFVQSQERRTAPPPQVNDDADRLLQAIRHLRQVDQEVIYLRYYLEFSEAETADALGVARGTVKSRLHRALGRLRQVIEQEAPELRESLVHE